MVYTLNLAPTRPGLIEITDRVRGVVSESGMSSGLCTLFLQHTSASLLIQENADPAVCRDLEAWLNRCVTEGDPIFTHTSEGLDDMPAHVKSALLPASLSIPVSENELMLGTWQGIFLFEHRRLPRERSLLVHLTFDEDPKLSL